MTVRVTLAELRRYVLYTLGDEWQTATEVSDTLGLGHGYHWARVALTLERLANDGAIEIRASGNRRRFRCRQGSPTS